MLIAISLTFLALGAGCFAVRLARGPTLADRVVALDGLVVIVVTAIVLDAVRSANAEFLVVAVVVAFIGFVGTAAAARFIEQRGA